MDLKVFAARGAFGAAVITALTAQNSTGVRRSFEVPADMIADQLDAVCEDLDVRAAKTGMLSSPAVVSVVAERVRRHRLANLVVDPVVLAKDGTHLLTDEGLAALRRELLPLATLVTPNALEAAFLSRQRRVENLDEARAAALAIFDAGARAVLVKGGHLSGEAVDLLFDGDWAEFRSPRQPGGPFHGTGCALSAAIAAELARGRGLHEAVHEARRYVQDWIAHSVRLGAGARLLHPGEIVQGERI
jgi:hydroxymethylpyrimidine/phosphomethylpyrimidine kinase